MDDCWEEMAAEEAAARALDALRGATIVVCSRLAEKGRGAVHTWMEQAKSAHKALAQSAVSKMGQLQLKRGLKKLMRRPAGRLEIFARARTTSTTRISTRTYKIRTVKRTYTIRNLNPDELKFEY